MKSLLSEAVMHGVVVGQDKLRHILEMLEENFVDVEMLVTCKGGRYFETRLLSDLTEYPNTDDRRIIEIEFRADQLKSKAQLTEASRLELEKKIEKLMEDDKVSRTEAISSLSDAEQSIVYKLSATKDRTSIKVFLGTGGTRTGFAGFRIHGDHYRETDWLVNDVRDIIASLRNPWDDYIWIRLVPLLNYLVSLLIVLGVSSFLFRSMTGSDGSKEVEIANSIVTGWVIICVIFMMTTNHFADRKFREWARKRVPFVVFLIGDQSRFEEGMKTFCTDVKTVSLGVITTVILSFIFLGFS